MRLFLALLFPQEIVDRLDDAAARLRAASVRGTFTRRENLHLTLAFLGETDRAGAVKRAMDRVAAAPFPLELRGMGKFRRDGGDICWVGVGESEPLAALSASIWTELAKEGFAPETRAFRPHLTLGRGVVLPGGFDAAGFSDSLGSMRMEMRSFSLMKSERLSGRLIYTALYTRALEAPRP